jgi:hypothetical protein
MVFDCVYGRREAVATTKSTAAQSDSYSLYHGFENCGLFAVAPI